MLLNHMSKSKTAIDTVIWEYPYLNFLNEVGELRQVLGRLNAFTEAQPQVIGPIYANNDWQEFLPPSALSNYAYLKFTPRDQDIDKIYISLRADGKRHVYTIRRSKHLVGENRPDGFYLSLSGFGDAQLTDLQFKLPKNRRPTSMEVSGAQR